MLNPLLMLYATVFAVLVGSAAHILLHATLRTIAKTSEQHWEEA